MAKDTLPAIVRKDATPDEKRASAEFWRKVAKGGDKPKPKK